MRTQFALVALAPLALGLAACGKKEETVTTPDDTTATATTAGTPTIAATDFPAVAANARTSVQYAGTYTNGANSLTLNTDDTYTLVRDGKTSNGTFNWYSDNSRILIRDGGTTHVFAIANGALSKLASADAPTTGTMTAEQTWRRTAN